MTGDPIWMKSLLAVHVTAGFGAFLLAPVALMTAKGGKQHKRWGMVYLWCMGLVAATALPMALFQPVLFLALVAILSFYLAFTGYRVLKLKSLARGSAQACGLDRDRRLFLFFCGAVVAGPVSSGAGAAYGHCGNFVRRSGHSHIRDAPAQLRAQADGQDVLVVQALPAFHCQLRCGMDGV